MQDLLNSAELKVTFEVDDLDSAKHLISQFCWDNKIESLTSNELIFNKVSLLIVIFFGYFLGEITLIF